MFGKRCAVLEMPADSSGAAGGGEWGYAGFWRRFAALIVDNAIVTIFGLALLIGAASAGEIALIVANLVYVLVAILYWPVMESSPRQATFGKQLLGLQVTDADGARLSFVRSLLRNLAKIISSIPLGLGFLLAAFTAQKQALHDMITKCLVVRVGPSHILKAVLAVVGALVITFAGSYYYFAHVAMPQMQADAARQMEKSMKAAKPTPSTLPPVKVAAPTPPPPPPAQPSGAPSAPTPGPMAAAAPGAPPAPTAPAPAKPASVELKAAPKVAVAPSAPPAKPAPVQLKPAPAKPAPATAPVTKQPAPAAKAKPAAKPVTLVSTAPAREPMADPVRRAAPRRPPEPPVAAVAPAPSTARSPRFNDIMTAVMYRDTATASELIRLGWWVDRPDSNGVTPLMAAAMNGDLAMTQLLLKAGADPNRRAAGGSVLDYASRGGDVRVVELLKRGGAK